MNPFARSLPRRGALDRLLERAPLPILVPVGSALVILGTLITIRPLTSLLVLGIFVAASAIISGVVELTSEARTSRWERALAVAWIAVGVGILLFLDRALDLLPPMIAALLLVGGAASIAHIPAEERLSRRVLTAAWGATQLVFGVLALSWPDVTVLTAAVIFGLRTAVFGVTLLTRAAHRPPGRRGHEAALSRTPQFLAPAPRRRELFWAAAGRYALAVILCVAVASGWALNGWLAAGSPVVDAFYEPPDDVPREHGRLLRVDDFVGDKPANGSVARILYTTRDALGAPAVASALVITPTEDRAGARPVVAWNHGTTGVARGCAPSLRLASATRWAIPGLEDALERGWVVVASDYSGQGAPGVFPYLIGLGEARSSLDAVLAAREIPGLALRAETVAWGHSQGGHTALWMSSAAADYAPEIDLLGAAVIAPVVDPRELAEEISRRDPDPLLTILISWVLVPYADTYDDVRLARYIAPGSRTIVREMTQRCTAEPGAIVSVLAALGIAEDRPLYVADLTVGPLGKRLEENAARGPWPTPLLVTWGDEDEVIPPRLQEGFVQRACAQGQQVRWVVYSGYDHLRTILPRSRFLPVLLTWTEARLLGQDAPVDDCTRYGEVAP